MIVYIMFYFYESVRIKFGDMQRKRGKCYEKIPKSLKIGQDLENPGFPRKIFNPYRIFVRFFRVIYPVKPPPPPSSLANNFGKRNTNYHISISILNSVSAAPDHRIFLCTRNCAGKRPSLRLGPSSCNFLKNALLAAAKS